MKGHRQALAFATAVLALPLFAYSQNSTAANEASMMKPANAQLVKTVDAKTGQGQTVDAKLDNKVKLDNGTELPKGAMLVGKVTTDDMQQQGMSKLALRFDQARLKNGTTVPIRATIVGFYGPEVNEAEMGALGDQIPNDWSAKTQQLDQENVVKDVDLHSKISSQNSGVFVSTKKDDVKLKAGSEIQFAIAPAASNNQQTAGGQ